MPDPLANWTEDEKRAAGAMATLFESIGITIPDLRVALIAAIITVGRAQRGVL